MKNKMVFAASKFGIPVLGFWAALKEFFEAWPGASGF